MFLVAQKSSKSKRKGVSFKNKLKLILHTLDMKSKITIAALLLAVVGGSVAFGVLQNTKFKSNSRAEGTEDIYATVGQQGLENESLNETEATRYVDCKSSGPFDAPGYNLSQDYCMDKTKESSCSSGYLPDPDDGCMVGAAKSYCCRSKESISKSPVILGRKRSNGQCYQFKYAPDQKPEGDMWAQVDYLIQTIAQNRGEIVLTSKCSQ